MKIAFFDHSYHKKTSSSFFFLEVLRGLGNVKIIYDELSQNGSHSSSWVDFDDRDYDLIVIWQIHSPFEILSGNHPNVLFVPMYDALLVDDRFFWKQEFQKAKILSFSWKLHQEVIRRGAISRVFQFFPDPTKLRQVRDYSTPRVFFWYRRPPIDLDFVVKLCPKSTSHLWVHNAPDPGEKKLNLSRINNENLKVSTWFKSRSEYQAALVDCNVFVAPRLNEGIGMGFLEAMAHGMCVIAPDTPTMNEIISDNGNGLLYDLRIPYPLDFSRVRDLGLRARETVEMGHERWMASKDNLAEYIALPTASVMRRERALSIQKRVNSFDTNTGTKRDQFPRISVVTVCLNAEADIEATILSVIEQNYPNLEYVVIDGKSTDGTIAIAQKYIDRIDVFQSLADEGIYDAMNNSIHFCTGEWVIFMNCGDTFLGPNALKRMFSHEVINSDIVYGNNLYVDAEGVEHYHLAEDFESIWDKLVHQDRQLNWLSGLPCHQSIAVRKNLLEEIKFDTSFMIAADLDFLFKARGKGARFFHSNELISIYWTGGFSKQKEDLCHREWITIAQNYGSHLSTLHLNSILPWPKRRTVPVNMRRPLSEFVFSLTRAWEKIKSWADSQWKA